jgi:hypothetical protein
MVPVSQNTMARIVRLICLWGILGADLQQSSNSSKPVPQYNAAAVNSLALRCFSIWHGKIMLRWDVSSGTGNFLHSERTLIQTSMYLCQTPVMPALAAVQLELILGIIHWLPCSFPQLLLPSRGVLMSLFLKFLRLRVGGDRVWNWAVDLFTFSMYPI